MSSKRGEAIKRKKVSYRKVKELLESVNNEVRELPELKWNSKGSTEEYWDGLYKIYIKELFVGDEYSSPSFVSIQSINEKASDFTRKSIKDDVDKIQALLSKDPIDERATVNIEIPDRDYAILLLSSIVYPDISDRLLKIVSNREDTNGNLTQTGITVNLNVLGYISTNLLESTNDSVFESYNDKMSEIEEAESLDFYVISSPYKEEGKRPHKTAGFFKYNHNTDLDLRSLQIYKKGDKDMDDGSVNCLISTLEYYKFSPNELSKVSKFVVNGVVAFCKLPDIAKLLNICINLHEYNPKSKDRNFIKKTYNKEADLYIDIGYVEEHYFPDIEIKVTSFALENYNKVKDIHNWQNIVSLSDSRVQRKNNRFIRAKDVVRILFENKDELLTKISTADLMKYSIKDYKNEKMKPEQPDTKAYEYKLRVSKFSGYYTFDTEACPFGAHKDFCGALTEIDILNDKTRLIASISSEDYLTRILELLPANKEYIKQSTNKKGTKKVTKKTKKLPFLIYVHNLKYDFSFIKKYLQGKPSILRVGGRILQVTGVFNGKFITFRDSYSLIPEKLSKFPKMFGFEAEKEVFPYRAYTEASIKQKSMTVQRALDTLNSDSEKKQFLENCEKIGVLLENKSYFDHHKYAEYYCARDTEILAKGLLVFRKLSMNKPLRTDIFNFVSMPSLAHKYFGREGVFDGVYNLRGIARDFHQKTVVGGRCQLYYNEPQYFEAKSNKEEEMMQDLDCCSLYPSAMERIGMLGGFLVGEPKPFKEGQFRYCDLQKMDGYFIRIIIKNIPIKRAFPVISKVEDNKRVWDSNITGEFFVDRFTMEDLIQFHGMIEGRDFEIVDGYYYNEGRNPKILNLIRNIFNERKKYKSDKSYGKDGNPIQIVLKLLMNSSYGKSIMKPIDEKIIFAEDEAELNRLIKLHNNSVKSFTRMMDSDKWIVKIGVSTYEHLSMPQVGSEILSMSKRIMNEVMCLAEDNGIKIYYQDTDSCHIVNKDITKLSKLYKEKYGRDLIGKNMGQFHGDFEPNQTKDEKSEDALGSLKFIGLAKKIYFDKVVYPSETIRDHTRMKGIKKEVIALKAKEMKETLEEHYTSLLNGEERVYDLAAYSDEGITSFEFSREFSVSTRSSFKRKICFKTIVKKAEEETE